MSLSNDSAVGGAQLLRTSESLRPGAYRATQGQPDERLDQAKLPMVAGDEDPPPSRAVADPGPDRGLAVALRVESQSNLMTAEPVSSSSNAQQNKNWLLRYDFVIPCGLIVLVLTAAGIFLAGISASRDSESSRTGSTMSETTDPPMMTMMTWPPPEDDELFPLPNYTRLAMQDMASPQAKAYMWLLADPSLAEYRPWRRAQRFALATMYYSTNGDQWKRNDGWLDYHVDECQWFWARNLNLKAETPCVYGYNESASYRVLWLRGNNLAGTIPPELSLLNWLADIQVEENHMLEGTLPTELFQLSQLHTIWIWWTGMAGTIPTSIAKVSGLYMFIFQHTRIEGTLPTELGALSNLYYLGASHALLTGTIPSELGLCTSLGVLDLEENSFSGTVPAELARLSRLELLYLVEANLSGTIPDGMWSARNLTIFHLEKNHLFGTIPTSIVQASGLKELKLSENSFSGSVPGELGVMENLTTLLLNSNQFTGNFPAELSTLSGFLLEELDVTDNELITGFVPSDLCSTAAFDCSESLCGCNCSCEL